MGRVRRARGARRADGRHLRAAADLAGAIRHQLRAGRPAARRLFRHDGRLPVAREPRGRPLGTQAPAGRRHRARRPRVPGRRPGRRARGAADRARAGRARREHPAPARVVDGHRCVRGRRRRQGGAVAIQLLGRHRQDADSGADRPAADGRDVAHQRDADRPARRGVGGADGVADSSATCGTCRTQGSARRGGRRRLARRPAGAAGHRHPRQRGADGVSHVPAVPAEEQGRRHRRHRPRADAAVRRRRLRQAALRLPGRASA